MALKIRLRQQGRTNRKLYRVVVTHGTAARDGRYVEMLGWYNPHAHDTTEELHLDVDRVAHWLKQGAQMTEKAEALVKRQAPEVIQSHHHKEVEKRLRLAQKRKRQKA